MSSTTSQKKMALLWSRMAACGGRSWSSLAQQLHKSPFHSCSFLPFPRTDKRIRYTYPGLAKHTRPENINGRERRRRILENLKNPQRQRQRRSGTNNLLTKVPSATSTKMKKLEKNAHRSFKEIGLNNELISALNAANITKPTEIQALGIPEVLKGRDVLMAAETGSGKTLAYLLPVMQKLREEETAGYERRYARPRVIVLAPSRELISQVLKVIKSFSHTIKVSSVGLSGFDNRKYERTLLDSQIDILVATPSRLLAHRDAGHLSFSEVRHVIIDEADSLFDQGFSEDIKKIILPIKESKLLTVSRQFVAVTATLPKPVDKLVSNIFRNVIRVTTPTLHRTVPSLRQRFVTIRGHGGPKHVQLLKIMEEANAQKTLIFCNTTGSCTALDAFLRDRKLHPICLHGDVSQSERSERLSSFINNQSNIMISTDIASRGIDILDIDHVILFDFPRNAIDYLHRVGRTARAGSPGKATSLIGRRDRKLAMAIQMAIRKGHVLGWAPTNQTVHQKKTGKLQIMIGDKKDAPTNKKETDGKQFGWRSAARASGSRDDIRGHRSRDKSTNIRTYPKEGRQRPSRINQASNDQGGRRRRTEKDQGGDARRQKKNYRPSAKDRVARKKSKRL